MFVVALSKRAGVPVNQDRFVDAVRNSLGECVTVSYPSERIALAYAPVGAWKAEAAGDEHFPRCVATGEIFGADSEDNLVDIGLAQRLAKLYDRYGPKFLESLNAQLACAIVDPSSNSLFIARDHLGIEPLYYSDRGDFFALASHAPLIAAILGIRDVDLAALARFLCFNYNPASNTIWEGIRKFPPGHYAELVDGKLHMTRYWRPSYANVLTSKEDDIIGLLRDGLDKAVRVRSPGGGKVGAFISGGLDSSTVLTLLSKGASYRVHTYSYRCRGQGFDESRYSRRMAEFAASVHEEIEFVPEHVLLIADLVKDMSEPFCDAGINVASAVLGRAAQHDVATVLTGDGGDELFGGHPIYEADKIARYTDMLPPFVTAPLSTILAKLPDTDKKKSLQVKLKRFGESLRFPRELRTQRWRLYYEPTELSRLLHPDIARQVDGATLFDELLKWYDEADADDLLGRALYADYFTVVSFYLRRNDLNRRLGIQTRYPLLDKELVELCARVPSRLKIRGWFDTKWIMKKTIEPWLPNDIVYRRDKLGHSIPLKNWMRESKTVRDFLGDILDAGRLRRRGFVNAEYVAGLWSDHLSARVNNSHRLWTLAVLELWLDEHFK